MTKLSSDEVEYNRVTSSMREVLKTPQGKEVVWYILGLAGLYNGDSGEPYLAGKRSVGIDILQLLEDVDKTAYARLILHFQED